MFLDSLAIVRMLSVNKIVSPYIHWRVYQNSFEDSNDRPKITSSSLFNPSIAMSLDLPSQLDTNRLLVISIVRWLYLQIPSVTPL